jgi:hypothetical protein
MIARDTAALDWLMSSKASAATIALCGAVTLRPSAQRAHPISAADFARCVDFLRAVPKAKAYLYRAANLSTEWACLVGNWMEIEDVLTDEIGLTYERAASAVRTNALMQAVLAGAKQPQRERY